MPKSKIPLKRVDSSGCVIYVGRKIENGRVTYQGKPYPVHEGEWVEILPVSSIAEYIEYSKLLGGDWTGLGETEKADQMRTMGATVSVAFETMVQELARRTYAWNWTDLSSKPLPQPHNRPDVIRSLSVDEVVWLVSQAEFEHEVERKNV